MYELAGDSRAAAHLISFLTVGLGGVIGWWLKSLIGPAGEPKNAIELGRRWAGWIVLGTCMSMLSQFFGKLDFLSLFKWLVGGGTWVAVAYVLGWGYGKFFKFKSGDGHSAAATESINTESQAATMGMHCTKCGKQLAPEASFCAACGAPITFGGSKPEQSSSDVSRSEQGHTEKTPIVISSGPNAAINPESAANRLVLKMFAVVAIVFAVGLFAYQAKRSTDKAEEERVATSEININGHECTAEELANLKNEKLLPVKHEDVFLFLNQIIYNGNPAVPIRSIRYRYKFLPEDKWSNIYAHEFPEWLQPYTSRGVGVENIRDWKDLIKRFKTKGAGFVFQIVGCKRGMTQAEVDAYILGNYRNR